MLNCRTVAALVLAMSIFAAQASAQGGSVRIPRSQIDAMFSNMKANTPWDLTGKLLWGYFFTSASKATLENAARVLVGQGYTLVEILPLQPIAPRSAAEWQLHVERVEHHTPDSLFSRDDELYAFADAHGLTSYDGMDVGPVK